MKVIDLRSDTVTQPTMKMREAMYHALVGDDVYEDDPTVKQLETLAAQIVGKEAALFVPTGTFGNQCAVLTHTTRGDEVILEASSHIKKYEVGGAAVIAGVQLNPIEGILGKMDLNKVKAAIRPDDIHFPKTSLICLENAVGIGTVLDLDYMKSIYELAQKESIAVHLDGARVFNAATALKVDVKEICQYTDSIQFCLSKGLCAPVGSILAGSNEFIKKARKNRKLMGGGMRQAGVLAACGIISLEEMTKRLDVDHEHALYLADQLESIPGFHVIRDRLQLNMVFVTLDDTIQLPNDFEERLLKKGIKINGYRGSEMRFVTHNDISKADLDYFVETVKDIMDIEK